MYIVRNTINIKEVAAGIMKKIKIITQSGSDLPKNLAEKYDIHVIPDAVIFGEEVFYSGETITAEQFYDRMDKEEKLPTSSQPNIEGFLRAYEKFKDYDEILCITVTSQMSGSYQTANIARDIFHENGYKAKVTVFDSEQVSFGIVLMLVRAAYMIKEGANIEEITDNLEKMKKNVGVYFVMDTLENAQKGGRVGKITGFAANMLKVKPVLKFDEGTVSNSSVAKNFEQGLNKVVEKYRTLSDAEHKRCYVFHAGNEKGANALIEKLRVVRDDIEVVIGHVGPVIGIYSGRGCTGIAFMKKKERA